MTVCAHGQAWDGWKTDGYPSYSLISRRYLSRTLTCSQYLRSYLIRKGYPEERVGVVKLGINTTRYGYTTELERKHIKTNYLRLSERTLVSPSSQQYMCSNS